MSGLRPVPSEAEIKALFAEFDCNGDRKLSYREMVEALEDEWSAQGNNEQVSYETNRNVQQLCQMIEQDV